MRITEVQIDDDNLEHITRHGVTIEEIEQTLLGQPAIGRGGSFRDGFTRGLATAGSYAFVGLSKIRPTSAMDGVLLAERRNQLKCGVAAIDLATGRLIGSLEFQSAVEEIFDLQLLSGIHFPEVMGFQKESVHHTFIIPRG
jgi:uncharacterized protein (TIGR03032 family)